jgi:sulfide dehydrogenase cytochrome subunit
MFRKSKLVVVALGFTITSVVVADVNKLAESCNACHGKDGVSTEVKIPTIAGMSAKFITSTFKAYKEKKRPCAETTTPAGADKDKKNDMCKIVEALSDADAGALVKFYSTKKFVRATQTFDAALAEKGKALHKTNCEKCHSEGGSLAADDAGMLAGQHKEYLEAALVQFNDGTRPTDKKMKAKLDGLAEDKEAMAALANYYASFK